MFFAHKNRVFSLFGFDRLTVLNARFTLHAIGRVDLKDLLVEGERLEGHFAEMLLLGGHRRAGAHGRHRR
jgi:hypothetical protein